jgi:hypothetical protein
MLPEKPVCTGREVAGVICVTPVLPDIIFRLFSQHFTRITNKRRTAKMIYINGHRASRADLARLLHDLKNGKQRATAHTTKRGALAIVTEF